MTIALPPLSAEQQRCSELFFERLRLHIQSNGPMPFRQFMDRCLYEPGYGYYVNGSRKIGAGGDFVTAPELSTDFADCIARQCAQVLDQTDCRGVIEFGAGSGALAADVLDWLDNQQCLPECYMLLDVSPDLQQRQRERLRQQLSDKAYNCVQWVQAVPDQFSGIAVANELFDAFAVDRFVVTEDGIRSIYVDITAHRQVDKFFDVQREDSVLSAEVERLQADCGRPFEIGFQSEFCALLAPWWQMLAEQMSAGIVLICDYGAERSQRYGPHAGNGSLRCFTGQTVHADPYVRPAVQDITADVDFTAVAEAALAAGYQLQGYTPMSRFMISLSALESYSARLTGLNDHETIRASSRFKQLTLPQEMGDRFSVIGFSKGVDFPLAGFSFADYSRLL